MKKLLAIICVLFVFSGCSNSNQASLEIYNQIEKAVLLEGDVADNEKLNKYEEEEKQLFSSIEKLMTEGNKEEIVIEANKALENVEIRQQLIQEKGEKISKSKEQFEEAIKLMEKKKVGEEFIKVAQERYEKNGEMLTEYANGLAHDENLYTLFSTGDFDQAKLNEEAKALNESYTKVLTLSEELKELTTTFNVTKDTLYKELGIEIK